jgi:hypothetical protein
MKACGREGHYSTTSLMCIAGVTVGVLLGTEHWKSGCIEWPVIRAFLGGNRVLNSIESSFLDSSSSVHRTWRLYLSRPIPYDDISRPERPSNQRTACSRSETAQ